MKNRLRAIFGSMIALLVAACIPAPANSPDLFQTLTPMSAAARATVTARAIEEAGGGDSLATAIANATRQADSIYATQTARAALYEPARLATATAIAPAVAELPRYGIDPADGYVAWVHDPVTLELEGYRQAAHANDFPLVTAADFVIAADVAWNTMNGIGSCGYLFRSDGDAEQPTQYMVSMERIAGGRITFGATVAGELSNYNEFFPRDGDPGFDWANDATNRLALVVHGNLIDIYTNGHLVGQLDITHEPPVVDTHAVATQAPAAIPTGLPSQPGTTPDQNQAGAQLASESLAEVRQNFAKNQPFFYDGFLAFLAATDTGTATCSFEKAWLFIIER